MLCDPIGAQGRVNVLVVDFPDHHRFLLHDFQFSVFQLVAVRREAAVPLALPGLLLPALHGLHQDVLPLNLRHGGKDRDHQLAAVPGAVDPVLHADQIDAVILHLLQAVQDVSGVAAKAGELEHQHILHVVLPGGNVLQHPAEFRPALDVFPGFSLVGVLPGDLHVLELRIAAQLLPLGVQAVPVHLNGRRNTGIEITFGLLFQMDSPPNEAATQV